MKYKFSGNSKMAKETIKSNGNNEWLSLIRQNIETLRFGVVQVVVHNSKIVQVERTEKFRFDEEESQRKEVKE